MTRRITDFEVDAAGLTAVMTPRTGLVVEDPPNPESAGGPTVFVGQSALVDSYERRVEALGDGRVRQTVSFETAIPFWGFLFVIPLRKRLSAVGDPSSKAWWLPPDRLDRRAVQVMATLALMSALLGYLSYLLSQTLTYAADEFGAGRGAQGTALAFVRLDIVPAVILSALADRRGRRRIVRWCLSGAAILTAVGALSPNLAAFTASQILVRGLLTAASIAIVVLAAEEVPARSRAFAISVLTAGGSIGGGACLVLLPLADIAPWAWRLLFVAGLVVWPLTMLGVRSLPESRRFEAAHPAAGLSGHGARLWLLGATALLMALFFTPASQFLNEYLREERGFSGVGLLLFNTLTNVPGAIGIIVGGRLADVYGRRIVAAVGVFGGVGLTVVVYLVAGVPLWMASSLSSIIGGATVPSLGVYGPELFPTGARGRANGVISGMGRAGSVIGLLLVGVLADRAGRLGPAVAVMAIGPVIVVALLLTVFPETAGVELETLNPEDAESAQRSDYGEDGPPTAV